jgi:hypothetical protein
MKALPGLVAAMTVLVASAFAGALPAGAAPRTSTAARTSTTSGPLAREAANTRVWFHPGETPSIASDIWSFDNGSASGYRRSTLPTTTAYPIQTQQPFTYRAGGTTVLLTWTATGGSGRIVTLGYTAATDTMLVNVDGRQQYWYGCKSAQARPDWANC